jgi:hypothetical protein
MSEKEQSKELKQYLQEGFGDVYYFAGAPFVLVSKLLDGLPNVDPEETQNDSPTMTQMVELAEKYNGTLEGHVTEGVDIVFEGFTIQCTRAVALGLKKSFEPDEFECLPDSWFRFWWD